MSNKRQRTTTSVESLCINDLPDGILVGISSYLAKPSIALFAKAMKTNDSQQQTETSKAILSAIKWDEVLDFGDIEKRLAAKLSDYDIDYILRCADAVNNLKILKLAGCINITGSGLDMLRSSVAIEQIDLSLAGKHKVPLLETEPLLSEDIIIRIVDDIISRGRASSLKQLELPKKMRSSRSTQMEQFLERYNQYLRNKRHCCSKCDEPCSEDIDWVYVEGGDWHGTQNYTCTQCLKHFCYGEDCTDGYGSSFVNWCDKCNKGYCQSCVVANKCYNCERRACKKCDTMKQCDAPGDCTKRFCGKCSETKLCSWCDHCCLCVGAGECRTDGCQKIICSQCDNTEGYCMECY